MWMDQEREESMCMPSSSYELTLSIVCDEILRKDELVIARRLRTMSLVFEVFIDIPF